MYTNLARKSAKAAYQIDSTFKKNKQF